VSLRGGKGEFGLTIGERGRKGEGEEKRSGESEKETFIRLVREEVELRQEKDLLHNQRLI